MLIHNAELNSINFTAISLLWHQDKSKYVSKLQETYLQTFKSLSYPPSRCATVGNAYNTAAPYKALINCTSSSVRTALSVFLCELICENHRPYWIWSWDAAGSVLAGFGHHFPLTDISVLLLIIGVLLYLATYLFANLYRLKFPEN